MVTILSSVMCHHVGWLEVNSGFREMYCLHLQSQRVSEVGNHQEANSKQSLSQKVTIKPWRK
jgi:hypothetical protein